MPANASPVEYDPEIKDIASYVHNYKIDSDVALDTSRYILLDTLGCGLEALRFPQCTAVLGPTVEGTVVPNGTKIPGTPYQLDPINGAFNIGAMIRWLDYNDCWLAAEWGHPSDNLGAILAVADWISRTNRAGGKLGNGKILTIRDVLEGMIKAHEIQGCLALENSYNKVGLDHVLLVKVASAAVVSKMLGLNELQTADVVSQAWVDGATLRTYRHSPNTMSRKSWAAGDACQRAVNLAMKVLKGQAGIPTVLSVPTWGFYDVAFGGNKFKFQREYGSYVMENVLFKVSYPAEFHSQTAVEAAQKVYAILKVFESLTNNSRLWTTSLTEIIVFSTWLLSCWCSTDWKPPTIQMVVRLLHLSWSRTSENASSAWKTHSSQRTTMTHHSELSRTL